MSWWDVPYKGGPMVVPAAKFPRPLFPPDSTADGKKPSSDGPDVIAYKRTICRLGRWGAWDPSLWDDTFSNSFAHGKSGNVADSGVAGFQRQMKIDDTGWIGQATFNALASARVPPGPHEGEMAMDSVVKELLADAWEMFGGKEPPAGKPAGKLTRKSFPSPNYSSRGGSTVRLIVIHTAEGARTIEDLGSFFGKTSSGVSSHTGIDDTPGTVGEYVKRDWKAWTAGNANPVAVQTELCAFAKWTLAEWEKHPTMLENCARWIAEEATAFEIPIVKLSSGAAQGSGRGVCQHDDLGSWGGGHWDCGTGFPIDDVLRRAKELM